MFAQELSHFLKAKAEESNKSASLIAKQAKISRATWYKLLNADIQEAKLSTLAGVSEALDIPPLQLMEVYFNGLQKNKLRSRRLKVVQ